MRCKVLFKNFKGKIRKKHTRYKTGLHEQCARFVVVVTMY